GVRLSRYVAMTVAFDMRASTVIIGVVVGTVIGLVSGAIAAAVSWRRPCGEILHEGPARAHRSEIGRHVLRVAGMSEMALSVSLFFLAYIVTDHLRAAASAPLGMDADRLAWVRFDLDLAGPRPGAVAALERLKTAVSTIPDVAAAGIGTTVPLGQVGLV